jgi:hypothetical protein
VKGVRIPVCFELGKLSSPPFYGHSHKPHPSVGRHAVVGGCDLIRMVDVLGRFLY